VSDRDDLLIELFKAAREGEPLLEMPQPDEIRAWRRAVGIKLPELAVALGGVSVATVTRVERGESLPSGRLDLRWRRVMGFIKQLAVAAAQKEGL
jgi:predicted transcriptional regulator